MAEMDNALQYQIYEQLRMLNNSVQNISQDRTSNYQAFSQTMQAMQMQQAQSMMPVYTSFSNPMAAPGMFAGGIHDFMQAQAQGLYSGFGITPQMQQFIQANMLQPTAAFVGNQFVQGKSLIGGLGAAAFTRPPLTMSFAEKEMLASTLASNTALAGTSVAQGVGTVAGGAAALYGAGTLAGYIGLGPLAAGAAVLYGGSKLLTSQTVANLTSGKFGGYDPRIFKPFDYMKDQIKEEKDIKDFLTTEAYRFISPEELKGFSGTELSRRQAKDWSQMILDLDKDLFYKDEEIQGMVKGLVNSGLVKRVGSMDEFRDDVGEYIDFIQNAIQIMGGTYDDIIGMMEEFKRAGIDTKDFDVQVANLKGYATYIQEDMGKILDYTLAVTSQRATGTTADAGMVQQSAAKSLALISNFYNRAEEAGTDKNTLNYIRNLGGPMGAEQVLYSTFSQVFHTGGLGANLVGAVVRPAEDGGYEIDEAKLDDLLSRAQQGKLGAAQLLDMYESNMSSWSDMEKIVWQKSSGEAIRNFDSFDKLKLLNLSVEAVKTTYGKDISPAQALSVYLGVDDYEAALLLEDLSKEYTLHGEAIEEDVGRRGESQHLKASANTAKKKVLNKNFVTSTRKLDVIYDHTLRPILQGIEDWIMKRTDKAIGVPPEASDYEFDPNNPQEDERIKRETERGIRKSEEKLKPTSRRQSSADTRDVSYNPASYTPTASKVSWFDGSFASIYGTPMAPVNVATKDLVNTSERSPSKDKITKMEQTIASISETDEAVDKAARVTKQHADVFKTYINSLERQVADLQEQLAKSNRNPTNLAGYSVWDVLFG